MKDQMVRVAKEFAADESGVGCGNDIDTCGFNRACNHL